MDSCDHATGTLMEPLTFQDVVVDFTEEEWAMLDASQRKLHRDVMWENINHLLVVGVELCESDVFSQLEPGEMWRERRFFRVLRPVSDTESEFKKHEIIPTQTIFRKVQPALQSVPQNFNPGGEPFTCNDSVVDSAFKSTFQMLTEAREKPYFCNHCGQGFRYHSSFTRHKQIHTEEKPYTCQWCGAAFRQRGNLRRHERTHTGEKPYKCGECGKAFSRNANLYSHQKTHAKKPGQSSECSPTTNPKTNLGSNPTTRPKNKPYVCRLCGQTFSQQSSLYRHGRMHTTGKLHVCQQCGKAFAQSYDLRQHERIHTGEKPYKCNICGRAFRRRAHIYVHQRTHTGEKPYRCSQCGAAFKKNCQRSKHQRTHTVESPDP